MIEHPYCTLDDVKRELRWKLDDVSKDSDLELAVGAASRFVEAHLRRDFRQHDHTAEPLTIRDDRAYGRDLRLPFYPILSLGEVVTPDKPLSEGTDFYVIPETGVLRRFSGDWPLTSASDSTVTVSGMFGFLEPIPGTPPTGLPEHVRRATAMIAAALSGYLRREQIAPDGSRQDLPTREIPKTAFTLLEAGTPVL